MSEIRSGNWSFRDPGAEIPDGSTISGGNFSQHTPDTPIMVGKPLTITGGNWTNVRRDPAWTITGGGFGDIERCANLHPAMVARGLPAEVENCSHVVETHEVTIDGVVVSTTYEWEDIVL